MNKLSIIIIVFCTALACNNSPKENVEAVADKEISLSENRSNSSNVEIEKPKAPADRKIIWNAALELQVEDVDKSTKDISALCSEYNAFISHMNLTNTNYKISNQITVRVDNQNFNKLINDIKGTAVFERKIEISSNDVTEEFVDIKSRLQTKKEVRDRYIDILKNRTGEVKDVIAAEDAIRKITEEIEAKEGRLRYLTDRVSYSTITIEIYQKVNFKSEPETFEKSFFTKTKEALTNGWKIVVKLVLILLNIWPIILIVLTILIWKRKWFRRKNEK